MSAVRSNQQGVTLEQHLRRKGLTDVSQILTRSGRDMALSNVKEIVAISSVVWDTQTDHERVTLIPLSAMSPKNGAALFSFVSHIDSGPTCIWIQLRCRLIITRIITTVINKTTVFCIHSKYISDKIWYAREGSQNVLHNWRHYDARYDVN